MKPEEQIQEIRKLETAVQTIKDFDILTFQYVICAIDKQIPKKPIEIKEMEYCSSFDCPSCGYSLYFDLEHVPDYYCRRCGQKIDWSEEQQ